MAILGLVSFSTLIQLNSKRAGQLRVFQEGLQTCFSRLTQTFTARTIGDYNSNYMTSEFKGYTEECFGEVLVAFENVELTLAPEILIETNKINLEVFELHKKTSSAEMSSPENVLMANISSRFEMLEIKRDNVLGMVDETISGLSASTSRLKYFFYFFCFATPLLILVNLMRNLKDYRLFRRLEKSSQDLLADEQFSLTKAESLISNSLKEINLSELNRLFEAYRTRKEEKVDTVGKPSFANSFNDKEMQLKEVWEENLNTHSNSCNVEVSVEQVIDGLSEKLFINGIKVDANIKKSFVKIGQEDLDQIIYYGVTALINEADRKAESRTLRMSLRNQGDRVILDILFTGSRLKDQEIARFQRDGQIPGKVELAICQQLLDDNRGEISMENRDTIEGYTSVISIFLERAPQGKLVDVKKTTKRKWLGQQDMR